MKKFQDYYPVSNRNCINRPHLEFDNSHHPATKRTETVYYFFFVCDILYINSYEMGNIL